MTASGIYQVIVRRGRQCGIDVFPHRFRHHFSHTWLDHGGAEGDLMSSTAGPPRGCSAVTAPAPAAREPVAATTASWRKRPDRGGSGMALAAWLTGTPLSSPQLLPASTFSFP